MLRGRHPVPVRSLVVEHQTEWLERGGFASRGGLRLECGSAAVFEIGENLSGDDVADIALLGDFLAHLPETRIVVVSLLFLSGENAPEVKALRL